MAATRRWTGGFRPKPRHLLKNLRPRKHRCFLFSAKKC